jgi:hypothetical protein
MMKIYLLFAVATLGMNALACTYSSPRSINIGVSLDYSSFFSYDSKETNEFVPTIGIEDCGQRNANHKEQYIMMALGPEVVGSIDTFRGTNYNKDFKESTSCNLQNNPLGKTIDFEDRKNIFNNRWKFINKCIEVTINELGSKPLQYPLDQEGCVVIPISAMSARFSGGYCFFKPYADSKYKIDLSISKGCLTLDGYLDAQMALQDINAELSAYTSTTYKNDLEDLFSLGTTALRVSVNPDKLVLKPSDDFGILRPTFPANYQINDLHLGKILIRELDSKQVNINVPFIVDNATCSKNVMPWSFSSACDYATPFTGTITLKDSDGQDILTWQDGGVAPANWQGILSGEGFRISKELVPPNMHYSLDIEFDDPQFSFNYFKKRILKRIGLINTNLPAFSREGTIGEIMDIKLLGDIDMMVEIAPIGVLNFDNSLVGVANSRTRLNKYLSTSMFPPAYEKSCNSHMKCQEANKTFAKFEVSFFLQTDYSITDLHITRKSDLLGSYTKTIDHQPEYICQQPRRIH